VKRLAVAVLLSTLLSAIGCSEPYGPLDGVSTDHSADGDGTVSELVGRIDKAALQSVIDNEDNAAGFADFDGEAASDTGFQHVGIDYNAHGHGPPGVNDMPHIDAHFYLDTNAEREAIHCDGEPTPADEFVPSGVVVNVGKEPFGGCVPEMGAHGSEPYDRLTANMIYGYNGGEISFVEPMIDIELLLAEEAIDLDVLQPANTGRATRWPTRAFVRYTDEAIEFVLTDFVTP
jgi:hypothetical protein